MYNGPENYVNFGIAFEPIFDFAAAYRGFSLTNEAPTGPGPRGSRPRRPLGGAPPAHDLGPVDERSTFKVTWMNGVARQYERSNVQFTLYPLFGGDMKVSGILLGFGLNLACRAYCCSTCEVRMRTSKSATTDGYAGCQLRGIATREEYHRAELADRGDRAPTHTPLVHPRYVVFGDLHKDINCSNTHLAWLEAACAREFFRALLAKGVADPATWVAEAGDQFVTLSKLYHSFQQRENHEAEQLRIDPPHVIGEVTEAAENASAVAMRQKAALRTN